MTWLMDKKVTSGFALAIVLLAGVGVLAFRAVKGFQDAANWRAHTILVLQNLGDLLSDMLDLETGSRGYGLTGYEEFLEPYRLALPRVELDFQELKKLTADNPRQQQHLQELEPILTQKIERIRRVIDLRNQQGLTGAADFVANATGKQFMDQIRQIIGSMREEEYELLRVREAAVIAGDRSTILATSIASLIGMIVVIFAGLAVNHDFAEQKRTERALSDTVKELEAFTYSVSHDLRAPLRHIDGFSQILLQQYGPSLDSQAGHYLQRVREGAQHMGRLVDDLLNLSRVGRLDLRPQLTGLNTIVEEVRRELQQEKDGREVEWSIGRLPFVECDPALIKQVFVNLLSNSLKYTRPRPMARIEVGQRTEKGQTVIFVRDNGVGFSMKYADKLFGIFQRLHRQEDFEGTGVGLATVQRIIARHSGRVWADAELDQGATFSFTLGEVHHNGQGITSSALATGGTQ